MVLSRPKLESLTYEFLKKTIKPCENCIKDSGVTKDKIDEVLLIGGATRMPKVIFYNWGLRACEKAVWEITE